MKYVKRTEMVDAFKFNGSKDYPHWFVANIADNRAQVLNDGTSDTHVIVKPYAVAKLGDYIVNFENGMMHVCEGKLFERMYQLLE